MNINDNRQNAHNEIDRIFKILLPARNMAERAEQVTLSHRMLAAMLDGGITSGGRGRNTAPRLFGNSAGYFR